MHTYVCGCVYFLCVFQVCGAEYERENADAVIERRQYGVDGDTRANHTAPLPHPFTQRPRIGVRLYVRGLAKRFLKPLLVRTHMCACLACVLVLAAG